MSTFPIELTARHMDVTPAMREHVEKKIRRLPFGQPRITDAKVVFDTQKHGQIAEIVFYCANHVTLEAKTETANLYEAFDLTLSKIQRQMRKEKTRLERLNHGVTR